MTEMLDLIAQLSRDSKIRRPLRPPSYWISRLLLVLSLYGLTTQVFLGLRSDIVMQLTRPLFSIEIILLFLLFITSSIASILSMYPDAYQKQKFLILPYGIFISLVGLVTSQLLLTHDIRMVVPEVGAHGAKCAICIASVALLPSALIFTVLSKGASIRQFQAGSLAVFSASAIGCLTLRLAEMNDSLLHLVNWHYLPTLLFAIVGACMGRWFLKW